MPTWTAQHPTIVSLRRLFPSASFVDCADIHITDVSANSRECGPKTLFAAIRGSQANGLDFVADAIGHGAASVLVDRPLADVGVPQCIVPNVREAYAHLCHALAGLPARRLTIAGVTGTNGKTTVTWLIRSILHQARLRTGLLGTIEYHDGVEGEPAHLTTPDAKTVCYWFQRMNRCRSTHAAIEISSHALDQKRLGDLPLDAAVITNVTQDHFDYHKTFQAYLETKSRIVDLCVPDGVIAINVDDAGSRSIAERFASDRRVVTYGLSQQARVSAIIDEESREGTTFRLQWDGQSVPVRTNLIGRHNVSNCLAAAAVAAHFGCSADVIATGIKSLAGVAGRLESVHSDQPFDVYVDYAHTPDALQRVLDSLRPLAAGRLICVIGAGGDRDVTKRPLLGKAAGRADLVILTSDNPRNEDPSHIIDDILSGCEDIRNKYQVEPDRAKAIDTALNMAASGDVVLVAGKGHESEQIIGNRRIPFDDRAVIRDALNALSHTSNRTPMSVPV